MGYNAMTEITREKQIKDKYCDIALKTDGVIRFLVEAKSAGMILRDRHIEQAERYAAEGNIPWVILTNGVHWILFHLSFDEGIEYERVFSFDLSTDSIDQAAEYFGLLHRQAVRGRALEAYWERRNALSPQSIGRALFTEDVLRFIRRSIRKYEGILIDQEDLAKAIHDMLSLDARERIGPLRVRRQRKTKSTKKAVKRTRRTSRNIDESPADVTQGDIEAGAPA